MRFITSGLNWIKGYLAILSCMRFLSHVSILDGFHQCSVCALIPSIHPNCFFWSRFICVQVWYVSPESLTTSLTLLEGHEASPRPSQRYISLQWIPGWLRSLFPVWCAFSTSKGRWLVGILIRYLKQTVNYPQTLSWHSRHSKDTMDKELSEMESLFHRLRAPSRKTPG